MNTSMLFEGEDLEVVLEEAQRCLGDAMQIENANRVRRGGILGFFAKEWFEVWASPPKATGNDATEPAVHKDRESGATFDAAFGRAVDDAILRSAHEDAIDEFFELKRSSEQPRQPSASGATLARRSTAVRAASESRAVSPINEATSALVALEDPRRGNSVFAKSPKQESGLLWDMLAELDRLPAPLPVNASTGIVAFVGDPRHARAVADSVGTNSGLWRGDVTVLSRERSLPGLPSWLLVNSIDEAADRLERWLSRGSSTPLIIDQPIDSGDRSWTADALSRLHVGQTRLVAEAWRLPSDVDHLISRIGPIDAIDLVEVKGTLEPLAMLDLGIPIATTEGRTATADLLAAIWLERRRSG